MIDPRMVEVQAWMSPGGDGRPFLTLQQPDGDRHCCELILTPRQIAHWIEFLKVTA